MAKVEDGGIHRVGARHVVPLEFLHLPIATSRTKLRGPALARPRRGQTFIAHGFSRGKSAARRGALEGRYNQLPSSAYRCQWNRRSYGVVRSLSQKLCRPFQGFSEVIAAYPRLKPWAMISRPLRGGPLGEQPHFISAFHLDRNSHRPDAAAKACANVETQGARHVVPACLACPDRERHQTSLKKNRTSATDRLGLGRVGVIFD